MIGVGIVGYGYAGRGFHNALGERAPGLELRAGMTRGPARPGQAPRERGVATYATLADLVADPAIDLVVIATPHDTHAALAVAALEAGKHVVVDKPLAITLAEADWMVEAARRADRMLSAF